MSSIYLYIEWYYFTMYLLNLISVSPFTIHTLCPPPPLNKGNWLREQVVI